MHSWTGYDFTKHSTRIYCDFGMWINFQPHNVVAGICEESEYQIRVLQLSGGYNSGSTSIPRCYTTIRRPIRRRMDMFILKEAGEWKSNRIV